MTTAERADIVWRDGGDWKRAGMPLLHMLGTEYGLRIHGLERDGNGPRGAADDGRPGDEDLGGSDHG